MSSRGSRSGKKTLGNDGRVSKWKQMFSREHSCYDEKSIEDLDDIIYWMRQVLSVVIGICFGIVPVEGATGILTYAVLTATTLRIYMTMFVTLDDPELFGPVTYLLRCGTMPGFGMFMVSWIITYTVFST